MDYSHAGSYSSELQGQHGRGEGSRSFPAQAASHSRDALAVLEKNKPGGTGWQQCCGPPLLPFELSQCDHQTYSRLNKVSGSAGRNTNAL